MLQVPLVSHRIASTDSAQGFAAGPLVFGPMSELYGRKTPLCIGFFVFTIFNIPVAVAQNLTTIMLCRFVGGLFGSAPLAIVGGALTDFWDPADRGVALCGFASATFAGPTLAPIVGGFIVQSYLGWRWTSWITLIMGAFFGLLGLVFVPESDHGTLLRRRASKRRYETKNWAIRSKAEESQTDLRAIVMNYLLRPISKRCMCGIILSQKLTIQSQCYLHKSLYSSSSLSTCP